MRVERRCDSFAASPWQGGIAPLAQRLGRIDREVRQATSWSGCIRTVFEASVARARKKRRRPDVKKPRWAPISFLWERTMWNNGHDAYLESRVTSADPVELVNLLYQGCTVAVREARRHLAQGRIGERSREINKAFEILVELDVS